MKKLRESRGKRYFEVPEGIEIHIDGVDIEDGTAEFYKNKFKNDMDCEKWLEENESEFKRERKFHVELKSTTITDDEWNKIKKLMTVPENFSKEDIRVYHPMLAHNFVDRDEERFRKENLVKFSKTIVDKPVLFGHEWGPPGKARFFDSKIVQVDMNEAVRLYGNSSSGFKKQLEKIIGLDGGLFFLNPSFYILKDNELLIREIDAGIIKDMSLGFRARKQEYKENDATLWVEYFDDDRSEALEGSFVWLGSQPGAQNRKSNGTGFQGTPEASDEPVIDKSHEEKPKIDKNTNFGGTMKIELKSIKLSKEIELNDEAVQGVIKEADEKFTSALAEVNGKAGQAETALETLKTETKANEIWVTAGKAYKESLVKEVLKYAGLLGLIGKDKMEDEEKFHQTLDIEMLKSRLDTYTAKWGETHPGKSQTPGPADTKKKIESNSGYQE